MTRRSSQPRRHRMRKEARRESARAWIHSGASVNLKTYSKRYGVDRYTAHDDLEAIGFPLSAKEAQWAVRPPSVPKRQQPTEMVDPEFKWIRYGDQWMFVAGYTSGGVPFGCVEGVDDGYVDDTYVENDFGSL